MNLEEKLQLARQLEQLNVDVIEAGFPIASEGDFEAVRQVAREVRGPVIAGLARAVKIDIDRAWEALQHAARPRIHTFIATSDIHLKYKLKKTREEVLEAGGQGGPAGQELLRGCRVLLRGCRPHGLTIIWPRWSRR